MSPFTIAPNAALPMFRHPGLVSVRKTSRWARPGDGANTRLTPQALVFEKHMISEQSKWRENPPEFTGFVEARAGMHRHRTQCH